MQDDFDLIDWSAPPQERPFTPVSDKIRLKNLDTGEEFFLDETEIPAPAPPRKSNPSARGLTNDDSIDFRFGSADSPENIKVDLFDSSGDPNRLNYAPFLIGPEKIPGLLRKWLETLWFAPSDILDKVTVSKSEPYYLPYWIFYATTRTPFSAEMCIIKEEKMEDRRVQRETWIRATGLQRTAYRDILLLGASDSRDRQRAKAFDRSDWKLDRVIYQDPFPAHITNETKVEVSKGGLLKNLTNKLEKTLEENGITGAGQLGKTTPRPDQLLACSDADSAWLPYEKKVVAVHEKEAASKQIFLQHKADRIKNLDVAVAYGEKLERKVHLPIFECSYVYETRSYKFVVNGHSGKISGDRPWGAGRIGEYSTSSLGLITKLVKKDAGF
eukprot:TRINITY_DN17767_c0_g1_i1.p1 TRINITY_DN17767_c0_g1~~TRINITY_DN17767_c0_g1_i1.p1  ORF type:complete len:392 (+),score=92.63 TRINITY_DN17767_c0_g1_i1:24-1178(+)